MVCLPSLLYPWHLQYVNCLWLQHITEPILTEPSCTNHRRWDDMESLDNCRERVEVWEQRTEHVQQHTRIVERRLRWWRFPWGMIAVIALGLALTSPHAVQAKTFHCGAGDGPCLINAINTANANGQTNMIRLAAGTYTLTAVDNESAFSPNGLPVITSPLTITGQGAETTIIERAAGAPSFRFFMVAANGILSLKRLTLAGDDNPIPGTAGAIANSGTLTVTRSTIRDFNVFSSGAIANSGTLTVIRSTIRDNGAAFDGGIVNSGGTITITNSTIANNSGSHESGGLNNRAGTVIITGTTFANNLADGGSAILNDGTLTVTNSAFTDNHAGGSGTGSIVNFGSLVVINTTFARNRVSNGFGEDVGAAIANYDTLLLINSTLADNQVTGSFSQGSALASQSGATTLLQNTLLARNVGQSGLTSPRGPDCVGVVTSLGTNLIGDPTSCTFTLQPSDLTGDPGFDAFTDNGTPGNGHFPLLRDQSGD